MMHAARLSLILLLVVVLMPSALNAFQAPGVSRSSARKWTTTLSMSDDKKTGTVKWFNTIKGFGFIMPDDGTTDVFVHQTSIQADGFRSLADGEAVEYSEELDNNGRKRAIKVTGPGGSNVQGAPFRPEGGYESY